MSENMDPQRANEKIIADELSKISFKEREEAYEDIHGVSDQGKETSELIESSLGQMQHYLKSLSDKYAYDVAESLSKDYVTDRGLRLKFLRASLFDPKEAASRMAGYFRHKLDLFGWEKLVKNITFEDLGEDSMEAISQGMMHQILPSRDTQGRAVICGSHRLFHDQVVRYKDPVKTLTKAFWYVFTSVADDEETQKKGFVFVSYAIDSGHPSDATRRAAAQSCAIIGRSLPARATAVHFCLDSQEEAALWRVMILSSPTYTRVRIRTHYGSHNETKFRLMSFGVPINDFPFLERGEVKKANHFKWIERRKRKEEYLRTRSLPKNAIDIPSRVDVILGRGTPFNSHPGNKRLHEIVADHYDEYDRETRVGKTKLAEMIVVMVHEYGGKFMKLDDECGMWIELASLDARNKVAHSFRRKRGFAVKGPEAVKVATGEDCGCDNKRLRASRTKLDMAS
ncbi:unnamed protein product [Cylindrotheca closterium]|uniref:DUF6824 domain-containing protein n=1 Tax=Cylindrotheca closterium TaxID=2856 RepID=A0AAD2G8T1_9STRA|nr:unnamed protein product [Cylindrotheca closterium]